MRVFCFFLESCRVIFSFRELKQQEARSRALRLIGRYCRDVACFNIAFFYFVVNFYSLEYRELWQRPTYVLHSMPQIKDKHLEKKRRTASAYVYASHCLPIVPFPHCDIVSGMFLLWGSKCIRRIWRRDQRSQNVSRFFHASFACSEPQAPAKWHSQGPRLSNTDLSIVQTSLDERLEGAQ